MQNQLLFIAIAFMAIIAAQNADDVIPAAASPAPLATPEQASNNDTANSLVTQSLETVSRWKRSVDARTNDFSNNTSLLFFTLFVLFVLVLMVICFCTGFYVGSATSRQAVELRNSIQTTTRYINNSKVEPPTPPTTTIDIQQLQRPRTRSKSNDDSASNNNDRRRKRLDELQIYDVRADQ